MKDKVAKIIFYKETPIAEPRIAGSYNHSVGGIKLKIEKRIAHYKYAINRNMDDAYKQDALEDLHKELFG